MKSIIQECKICNIKSRWTYRVSLRKHKSPIVLCDDCLINSYKEMTKNNDEKMKINNDN
jgi:hypothetical protein